MHICLLMAESDLTKVVVCEQNRNTITRSRGDLCLENNIKNCLRMTNKLIKLIALMKHHTFLKAFHTSLLLHKFMSRQPNSSLMSALVLLAAAVYQ